MVGAILACRFAPRQGQTVAQEPSQAQRNPVGDRTLRRIGDEVAVPSVHLGGGAAAAASASLAAASAELVVSLSIRKKTPPDIRQSLARNRDRLQELRDELLKAADEDEAALDDLMDAYARRASETERLPLLERAAHTVLEITRKSAEVVEISAANVEHASRFTVSDLGAAAALAHGAVVAAALTVDVNLRLLAEGDADQATVDRLRAELETLEDKSKTTVDRAVARTKERLGPRNRTDA